MTIQIDDPELVKSAESLAAAQGKSLDELVMTALGRTVWEAGFSSSGAIDWDAVHRIQDNVAKLPVLDDRSPDELLGYNVAGNFD